MNKEDLGRLVRLNASRRYISASTVDSKRRRASTASPYGGGCSGWIEEALGGMEEPPRSRLIGGMFVPGPLQRTSCPVVHCRRTSSRSSFPLRGLRVHRGNIGEDAGMFVTGEWSMGTRL